MPNMNPKKCPMPEQAPDVRNKNFEEVTLGYTAEMAVEEAQRCLNCKNKPCMTGCPVQVKIPEFIALVAEGKFLEAAPRSRRPPHCPLSAVVSARRRASASATAYAASRVRPLPSAVWSAL